MVATAGSPSRKSARAATDALPGTAGLIEPLRDPLKLSEPRSGRYWLELTCERRTSTPNLKLLRPCEIERLSAYWKTVRLVVDAPRLSVKGWPPRPPNPVTRMIGNPRPNTFCGDLFGRPIDAGSIVVPFGIGLRCLLRPKRNSLMIF